MKKVISYLLLVITVMTCTVPYLIKSTEHVSAASSAWKSGTVITSAKGKDYTSNEALAGKLDNIFAGHISIYTDSACKNEKVAALGTYSVVPENKFYIGTSYYTGESCYAYANGVYYTLFNEIAGHHGSSSVEIGISTISESAFNAGGVNNAPGAYIVMGTHKQILLGYNSDSITIVDGNNDANGYVCIRKFTWSDYESLTRHYAGSSNITVIQRKDYWSIYPIDTEPPVFSSSVNAASLMCMEDGEDGFTISFDVTDNYGVTTCYANIWEYGQTENDAKKIDLSPDSNGHVNAAISTSLFDGFKGIYNVKIYAFDAVGNCAVGELNPETPINLYESNPQGKIVGTYSAVKDNVPVREAPYSKVNGKDTKVASISKDTKVAIIGIYVNDFENDWYQLDNGNWIYSENLKKVSAWNRYIERLNQIAQKGMYQFFWEQPIYSSNTSHGGGAAAFSAANGLVKAGQDYIYAAIDLITSSYRASNGSTGNSFVIEFNANGGSCYTRSKIVSEGASYGWLPTPSRYGYTFDGWFTDATAGEHVTESTVAISGSVLYAHWTRIILASGQCGDNLKYTLYGDGELCITGSGEMSSHPWTSNYAGRIADVNLPDGLTNICNNAFYQCTGIVAIEIPDTVTEIGSSAFYGCLNLTTVSGMKNVTKIESSAFYGCKKLSNIELPLSLTELGNGVFSYCTSLETTSVPSSLNTWGYGIYRGCTSLKSVTIPEGFMNIPSEMFMNCSSLTDIALPTTMKVIRSSAFEGSGLTNITLPYGCTEVQASAFKNSVGLISANIPDSVTSLGSSIFEGCSSLTDVNLGRNISSIPQNAFKNCESLKKLVVPYYTTEIGNNAFNNDTAFTEITIPRNVTSISSTAFSYPDKLTIYGVPGTYAETYAGNNGIKFVGRESNAKEVKLNTSQITINKEDSYQLNMTVTPADYTDQIIWKSSDTSVATVSEKGIVKGIKGGTTTIKLTVGNVSTSCSVTVLQPVTSIYVNSNPTLGALETYQLSASVYPSDANNKTLIWTSSDTAVATVSNTGLVTAIGRGTATITATATDGSEVYDTCIVTVKNNLIISNDVDSMECEHNYFDNCSDIWQYTSEGAKALDITFDSRTYTESGFDYIYIMDKDNTVVGEYTGNELASHTVRVNGDTVRIKLVSDGSGTEWGFKVTKIAPVTSIHAMEFISTKEATCTDEGHNAYYHCKDCGKFFKDENGTIEMTQQEVTIPALGHDWVYSQTVEPTYTDDGYTLYICSRCDETKKSDYTDKLILKYPELTSASNTTSGIQLKWSKVTDATGYILYRKTGNGSWSRIADIKNGSTVSYIDKTAKSGTTYTYTIRAYSGKYMSDWKTTKTIKRLADPTVSSASNITAGVQVKWSKVTGATGYIVYRKTGKGSWSRIATIKSGSTTGYTDKSAKSGTNYSYTVRACNGSTMSDWHNYKTVKRLSNPAVTSASKTSNGINVKWSKVTGATGYVVYRKTAKGSWSRIANIKSGSTTSYTDTKASRGVTYIYTVRAYNGSTMSSFNSTRSAKR